MIGAHKRFLTSATLAVRGESAAAFEGRCIPADCVAPPSNMPNILRRRALSAGRLDPLGATPHFHHGLLAAALAISFALTSAPAPKASAPASVPPIMAPTSVPPIMAPASPPPVVPAVTAGTETGSEDPAVSTDPPLEDIRILGALLLARF